MHTHFTTTDDEHPLPFYLPSQHQAGPRLHLWELGLWIRHGSFSTFANWLTADERSRQIRRKSH